MQIEHIDPKELKPHPQNSRVHADEQIQQIVASIRQFGFNSTITIDEDNVILAGHGRTLAAIAAGLEAVPCIRRAGLTDLEKRAFIIADNQIGLNSEWDDEVLTSELAALLDGGLDLGDFGIPLGALSELEAPAPVTASDIQAMEGNADSAPITPEEFHKEMSRTDTAGILPIVPMYGEHHEAFVIVCDNAVDEAWLRNRLGLDDQMRSYKDVKAQRANVITVQQLRERWQ